MKYLRSPILEDTLVRIIQEDRRYCRMLLPIGYYTSEEIPTAGIDKEGRMIFNPKFLASCSETERVGLVKHELFHYLLRHISRGGGGANQKIWNVAADMAIDQLIPEVPREGERKGIFPEDFDLPRNMSVENYYQLLMKESREKVEHLAKIHFWAVEPHRAEENVLRMEAVLIREGSREPRSPVLEKIIERLRPRPQTLNWKDHLGRGLRGDIRSQERRLSYKRADRRFETLPTLIRSRESTIGVVLDTSGSVWSVIDELLREVHRIALEMGGRVIVLEADTEVLEHYVLDPHKPRGSKMVKGGGGTLFQPALDWFEKRREELQIGAVVYVTDGYGENPTRAPSYPLTWALTTRSSPASFGRRVRLPGSGYR